mgnify:CR=1 FL=1
MIIRRSDLPILQEQFLLHCIIAHAYDSSSARDIEINNEHRVIACALCEVIDNCEVIEDLDSDI